MYSVQAGQLTSLAMANLQLEQLGEVGEGQGCVATAHGVFFPSGDFYNTSMENWQELAPPPVQSFNMVSLDQVLLLLHCLSLLSLQVPWLVGLAHQEGSSILGDTQVQTCLLAQAATAPGVRVRPVLRCVAGGRPAGGGQAGLRHPGPGTGHQHSFKVCLTQKGMLPLKDGNMILYSGGVI